MSPIVPSTVRSCRREAPKAGDIRHHHQWRRRLEGHAPSCPNGDWRTLAAPGGASRPASSKVCAGRGPLPWTVLGVILLGAVGSCGCGETGSARSVPRTNIVTGSTGSTWYTMGSALAEKANQSFAGYPVTAVPGAGGVSNPVRVSMTGTDLGISYGPFLRAAYRGEPPFREPIPRLRVVASLVLNTLHVVANPSLGLSSVRDVGTTGRGVRMGAGPPGSGDLFCLTALLEVLGVSVDDWQQRGGILRLAATGQRFDDWKDGRLDLAVSFINDPSPQLSELMLTRPGRLLPVPPDIREALTERWGFVSVRVPPDTYPNQDYAIDTVALPSILFAVDTTDASIVYAVTKALYEQQDYLLKVQPAFEHWDPRALPREPEVPFHDGALRYYREQGFHSSHLESGTQNQARKR